MITLYVVVGMDGQGGQEVSNPMSREMAETVAQEWSYAHDWLCLVHRAEAV